MRGWRRYSFLITVQIEGLLGALADMETEMNIIRDSSLANVILAVLLVATGLVGVRYALAGQAPAAASDPDIPISHQDRVYSAEQYSNTVSVTDPVDNKLVGTIRLGDPLPANLSPLYKGQLLVHGMGFSPDHRTIAVVAIGSNAIIFIDTATNSVKHITYVGRSPHEAFYTMDGKEVWVVVRGENYVSVLDGTTYEEKTRITVPNGPGMTIFSPDGKYGYVCSSFTPETEVITVADHKIVGKVPQASPFCPNIAATPDSKQVWFTLKDSGKTQVFDGQPPFALLKTLDTGPITNHVNIVRNANGMFAYVTIGGLNEIKVFRTDNFAQVATIPVGKLPHGIWPSGDGTRVYVGLENEDKLAAIDTLKNEVIATSPIGQAPQALAYVPDAVPAVSGAPNSAMTRMMVVPEGLGTNNLQPLGIAGQSAELWLAPPDAKKEANAPTSVSLSDQGLVQVLEAAVTGLEPGKPYLLALASEPSGTGALEPLQGFMTNPAGAAIVNAIGPIRQLVRGEDKIPRRYLVILPGTPDEHGAVVQVQKE
jgi:YVTN family beta-propeller protein